MEEKYERAFNTIINASIAIKGLYEELAEIELNNQKESKEYYNILKKLAIMQEIEDLSYEIIDNKIESYYDFLYEYDLFNLNKLDEVVMDRISNYLIYRTESSTDKDSRNFFQEYYGKQVKRISQYDKSLSFKKMSIIEKHVYENILNTYLYFLELKSKNNPNLVKEKYNAFNMYKHKEKEFIKNKFNAQDIYYIDYKTIANFLKITPNLCKEYIDSIIRREYASQLENLFNEDKIYNSETKRISEECFLRAIFTLAEPQLIDEFNELFHKIIDDEVIVKSNYDYTNIIDLITKSFKCVKKDRKKVKILSIGYNPNN